MRNVVDRAEGVLQHVIGKAKRPDTGGRQVVEGHRGGPHQRGPSLVVVRVGKCLLGRFHDGLAEPLDISVLDGRPLVGLCEVPLQEMRHCIRSGKGGVRRRYCVRHRGIQDGHLGVERRVVAGSQLVQGLVIGQHHAAVHFGSRRGNRHNGQQRQGRFHRRCENEELQDVGVGHRPGGNALRRVDNTSAPHCHDYVDLFGLGQCHALPRIRKQGVGSHPWKLDDFQPRLPQRPHGLLVDTVGLHAAHAVHQQGLLAVGLGFRTELRDGSLAKNDLRRVVENEVFHLHASFILPSCEGAHRRVAMNHVLSFATAVIPPQVTTFQ